MAMTQLLLARRLHTQRRIEMNYSVEKLRHRNNGTRAKQIIFNDGTRVLISYETVVASVKDDKMYRHWDKWKATTGKHIAEFMGVYKKEWDKMPVVNFRDVLTSDQSVITEYVWVNTHCKYATPI